MRLFCTLAILLTALFSFAQKNKWGYPVDEYTNKITFQKTLAANGTKEELFKRAKQFLAVMDFGKKLNFTTHSGKQSYSSVIKQPVTYEDSKSGKIFGNGYLPFEYRGHDYFLIIFTYRLSIDENQYKYAFTDFFVHEVIDPGFFTDGRRTKSTSFPLEEFVNRKKYDDSDPIFLKEIKKLRHNLRLAMNGEL